MISIEMNYLLQKERCQAMQAEAAQERLIREVARAQPPKTWSWLSRLYRANTKRTFVPHVQPSET